MICDKSGHKAYLSSACLQCQEELAREYAEFCRAPHGLAMSPARSSGGSFWENAALRARLSDVINAAKAAMEWITMAYTDKAYDELDSIVSSPDLTALVEREKARQRVIQAASVPDWSAVILVLLDHDMTGSAADLEDLLQAVNAFRALKEPA